MQIPVLETERLILRAPEPQDFDAWAAFCADPEAMRFLGGPADRIGAWRIMSGMAGGWMSRGFSMFSVVEKATGRWVGRLGPWQPEGWPGTEVGWGLARDAWGRGYATEGAAAAIDWAFDALGWTEVIHTIEAENIPSQAVATRLGSRILRQATLPPPLGLTVDCWGQSRVEWRARRRD
ncbi:GNAT family N-acetyltransferase [Phenylobacterium sp.]|uniref:GNAT family N-acetyltransferase n=1 Tax=Phenylobacterium sp. TaxID=1871053 RepID=UPI00301D71E8